MNLISLGFTTIHLALNEEQKEKAMHATNLHWLGDEHANEFKNGKWVPKYPERETPESNEAAHALHRSVSVTLEVFFDPVTGQKIVHMPVEAVEP